MFVSATAAKHIAICPDQEEKERTAGRRAKARPLRRLRSFLLIGLRQEGIHRRAHGPSDIIRVDPKRRPACTGRSPRAFTRGASDNAEFMSLALFARAGGASFDPPPWPPPKGASAPRPASPPASRLNSAQAGPPPGACAPAPVRGLPARQGARFARSSLLLRFGEVACHPFASAARRRNQYRITAPSTTRYCSLPPHAEQGCRTSEFASANPSRLDREARQTEQISGSD